MASLSHPRTLLRTRSLGRPAATPLFLLTNSPRGHVDGLFHRFHPSGNGPITSTRSEARATLAKACARSARACPCAWVCVCVCVCVCVSLCIIMRACVRAFVCPSSCGRGQATPDPLGLDRTLRRLGGLIGPIFFFFTPLPIPPSLPSVPHTFTHANTHLFSTSTHIHTTLLVFL